MLTRPAFQHFNVIIVDDRRFESLVIFAPHCLVSMQLDQIQAALGSLNLLVKVHPSDLTLQEVRLRRQKGINFFSL